MINTLALVGMYASGYEHLVIYCNLGRLRSNNYATSTSKQTHKVADLLSRINSTKQIVKKSTSS